MLSQVAQQVAIAVENALAYKQIAQLKDKLTEEKLYLEEEIQTDYNFEEIVGESRALKQVLKQVKTVAPTDSTVLILGETGSGKELVARALHNLSNAAGTHVRETELRRDPDRPARKRIIRARKRRLYRCDCHQGRPV